MATNSVRDEQRRPRVRIATLEAEVYRAIGTVLEEDADLTHEEVCVALNDVMARQLMHLMSGATDG